MEMNIGAFLDRLKWLTEVQNLNVSQNLKDEFYLCSRLNEENLNLVKHVLLELQHKMNMLQEEISIELIYKCNSSFADEAMLDEMYLYPEKYEIEDMEKLEEYVFNTNQKIGILYKRLVLIRKRIQGFDGMLRIKV